VGLVREPDVLAWSDASFELRPEDSLRSGLEPPFRRTFFPLGYSVEIIANEPDVLLAAGESFGHVATLRQATPFEVRVDVSEREGAGAVCPPEPMRRAFNHLFLLVADAQNQAVLDFRTGANFTWITRGALSNHLYFRSNFLEKVVYLLLGASVVTDLHAACVGRNGKGILLCGRSGAGKSTLAYACARAGWTYTSDDTSYLINDSEIPRVIGHCHRARFRPAARDLFPELVGRALTPRMEGKPSIEIPISELPVEHRTAEATIHAVVFLNRHDGADGKFAELPRGSATERLRQELYSTGEIRERHERLLGALWDMPAFELHYWNLDDGVMALDRLLQTI